MNSTGNSALLTVLLAKHITSCNNVFLRIVLTCNPWSVLPYLISEETVSKNYFKNKNDMLFFGSLWLIKSNIFQNNQVIRMINLKVNENKTHK